MATVTPNFNWPVPTSTDLVKDGATAIEALGDAIDTSMVDLKGGTTGQVLAKASSADMDFSWTSPTTGDITGVTAGTGLTGGGTSGTVSLAFDIANYGGGQWAAGKNKVINGNFGIWQRGTSFSLNNSAAFTADRWYANCANTVTVSQQTFTPGTAPVAGYEGQYFLRFNRTARPTIYDDYFINRIEDVRTFAGQTVTMSFWAKTNSGTTTLSGGYIEQNFGSGGSSTVYTGGTAPLTLTTSWQRFEAVVTMPSIAGKTIGTGSYVTFNFAMANSVGTSAVYDIWGCQLEAGSTATPFQTATGTIQGELAACQRYFVRFGGSSIYEALANAQANSTTGVSAYPIMPVQMRVAPTSVASNAVAFYDTVSVFAINTPVLNTNINGTKMAQIGFSGGSGLTQFRYGTLIANNSTSAYLDLSAEL